MRGEPTKQRSLAVLACAGLLGLMAGGAGCVPDFRGASQLDETNQVLAVRATPPMVNPGATVTLDALVHWPAGTPTLFWLVCIPNVGDTFLSCLSNQGEDASDPPFCAADPTARLCLAGLGESVEYAVPESIFPDDGEDHTFFVNMIASGGGFDTCAEVMMGGSPTPDCLLSLKRVVVSYREPAELNVNPELSHFVVDGGELDPSTVATLDANEVDVEDIRLEVSVTAEATSINELYPPGADPIPFDLVASFFTTCGKLSLEKVYLSCAPDEVTAAPHCEPASVFWRPETTGPCTFHAVLRDGNGGLGWLTQQFEIQ
jgi:hypothetical protein